MPFHEVGFQIECILPRKHSFCQCMGVVLANLHHPRDFVTSRQWGVNIIIMQEHISSHLVDGRTEEQVRLNPSKRHSSVKAKCPCYIKRILSLIEILESERGRLVLQLSLCLLIGRVASINMLVFHFRTLSQPSHYTVLPVLLFRAQFHNTHGTL